MLKHLVDEEIEAESNAPKECLVEMKLRILKDYCNLVTERNSVGKLWTCEDYSTLGKLLRVTRCILKFVRKLDTSKMVE